MADLQKRALPDKKDVRVADQGLPPEVVEHLTKTMKAQPQRGLVFEEKKQRNATFIQKGLTKPGKISYDTLRRASLSVHVARICINVLKEKITKTKWVIQPIDPMAKVDEARVKEVEELFKHPNQNNETFRTLLDKILEDLLVLDAVSIEKTRYPDGKLAEMFFVDSATIRPVYDQYGNQDVEIPLKTEENGNVELPVSYLQILNNSQYGGPESGDIVAAWPKRDMIHFNMHPQGSMEGFGYGLSPLEGVLSVVANLLNADNYNSNYFEEGSFPPIIMQLVGTINQRDLEAYREYMIQEMTGNFHRPAVMSTKGAEDVKIHNLKDLTNRDMQFMEYTVFLAKLLCAAYGLSPQDIGLTDDVNRATAQVQKDLSEGKGYGSILHLLKEVFNQEIIWKDFGYTELEFEWVAPDSTEPDQASQIYDRSLKNGTMTINEVRQKMGEMPYGDWADKPMMLGTDGYRPIDPAEVKAEVEDQEDVGGEHPYNEQEGDDKGDKEEKPDEDVSKMQKAIFTASGFRTFVDDRGYSQPFIYTEIKTGLGGVIKPPVAVNLTSQSLETEITLMLNNMGLNVNPVRKMTYLEVIEGLRLLPEVVAEFENYCYMMPEYDSERWRARFGGSRKFSYYLCSEYTDGYHLNNPLLIADMKRDPNSYRAAVIDLANLWKAEKELVLGDRRADQYLITKDKRGFGIDYQFKGDKERWEKTKDSIEEALAPIPQLQKLFRERIKDSAFSFKSVMKSMGFTIK